MFLRHFFRPTQASSILPPSQMPNEHSILWDRLTCFCLKCFLYLGSILSVFMYPNVHVNHSCVSPCAEQSNYYVNHRSPVSIDFFLYLHKWIVGLISYDIMLLEAEFKPFYTPKRSYLYLPLRYFHASMRKDTVYAFNFPYPLPCLLRENTQIILFCSSG